LKEGLTVFRDQEFSSDMNSRPVKRIEDVRLLRNVQFKEDGSPMAHPVRPDAYYEINNFYTATVYNKGAEVVRMIHTLVGSTGFRRGMDLYFQRHDGQAVTCDDFVAAMADANGIDLQQFKRWYSQAGTPVVDVQWEWNEKTAAINLKISQSCPPTPGQQKKEPFVIPLRVGAINAQGDDLLMDDDGSTSALLLLSQESEEFTLAGVKEPPVLSFLRGFSAPVKVNAFHSRRELAVLAAHDSDLFCRWESASRMATEVILEIVEAMQQQETIAVDQVYLDSVAARLVEDGTDQALQALSLQLPQEMTLAQELSEIYPETLSAARRYVRRVTAETHQDSLMALYHETSGDDDFSISPEAIGRRSLKNTMLGYLMALEPLPQEIKTLCLEQYYSANNMTDCLAALSLIVNTDIEERVEILEHFYANWKTKPLVVDKWFALQATADRPQVVEEVQQLLNHEAFSMRTPNRVRALVGSFSSLNHRHFHREDGRGYTFLADRILELNQQNPQIAARLLSPLINFRRYQPLLRTQMEKELERIMTSENLSQDVYEIVKKSLNG
jgi:aminopeptidase N